MTIDHTIIRLAANAVINVQIGIVKAREMDVPLLTAHHVGTLDGIRAILMKT